MNLRDKTISHIIDVEGGYVDDPSDSGGETNFGITVAVARAYGYTGSMRDMPREVAYEIYLHKYWHALQLDRICDVSELVAAELADTGVNMGIARAGKFLQNALNAFNNQENLYRDLTVDGQVGNMTVAAFLDFYDVRGDQGCEVLHRALNAQQGAFYLDLSQRRQKDEKFVYGWFLNRVE